ncbi:MAG: hypothetical protein ACR2FU_01965 [Streptosporangiaceae bacterium]
MKSDSKTRKVLRVLLVAVASLGIAAGAAACGPAAHKHHSTGPAGY